MTEERFNEKLESHPAIVQSIFHCVPKIEMWTLGQIAAESARQVGVGSKQEVAELLQKLVISGLVIKSERGTYQQGKPQTEPNAAKDHAGKRS